MINPIKSFNCMEQWLKPCQSDNPLPLMWFIIIPYGILGTQISIQIVAEQKLSWHPREQAHLDGIM